MYDKWFKESKCPICRYNINTYNYKNINYRIHLIDKNESINIQSINNNTISNNIQSINRNIVNIHKYKYIMLCVCTFISFFNTCFNVYLLITSCNF